MKTEIDFLIIPLQETETQILADLEIAKITNQTNIYCCSLDLVCKLIQYDNYPIKSKRIAITNILEFLKWADTHIDSNNSSLPKTCLPIGRDVFESFFTRNEYNEYIALLKEFGVMCLVPYEDGSFYQKGKKNNLFRFYNKYMADDTAIFIADQQSYGSLVIEGKHSKKMINTIKSVQIDYKNAIIAEIRNYKENNLDKDQLRKRMSKLFSLNGDRYIKYGYKVDRVYHSLTNLSKISREYLHVNGTRFNNIDVVNCQPLLLCYYLIKNNLPIDPDYITKCEAGCFYEQFYSNPADRTITKQQLYKSVYFDFKPSNSFNKRFAELYPQTHQSLAQLALKEETLASLLQNTEAEIFNDLDPVNSKYYFTLFDAIYFSDFADLLPLRKTIKDKFALLGLSVRTTINGCGEEEILT